MLGATIAGWTAHGGEGQSSGLAAVQQYAGVFQQVALFVAGAAVLLLALGPIIRRLIAGRRGAASPGNA
jgi:hypothetical protein